MPTRSYTPVVPSPQQRQQLDEPPRRHELKAPIIVVAGGKEWELAAGALIIGRDPDANIAIPDPLISRWHARLATNPDGQVIIEDLQSANGVFVNGTRLLRPVMPLSEGDRLLLGTTEISVFSLRSSATVLAGPQGQRSTPVVGATPALSLAPEVTEDATKTQRRRRTSTTERSAPIDMIGQFAEQLAASGHRLDAVRTLSDPLHNLLKGASAGLVVPAQVLRSASKYALRLREWTQRDIWAEYVLELHLACRQVPSDEVLSLLEDARSAGAVVDRTLAHFLVTAINGREEPPTTEEQTRLRRIETLVV